jgi:uncharacterized protein (TIGR02246 family)
MRIVRLVLPVIVLAATLACSQAPAGPQFTREDVDAITKQIQELKVRFNAKDPDKVVELFSANAVVMPPNQSTARAKEAVREYYVGRFAEGATELELDPKDISGVGNLAYASGDYRLNFVKEGQQPERDRGKFIWIFRRTNDRWLIEYVIFSSDFAPHA